MSAAWRAWLRPSLTGRVVRTLLLALLAVGLVLTIRDFIQFRSSTEASQPLLFAARAIVGSLPDHEADAAMIVRANERQYNEIRHASKLQEVQLDDLLFELAYPADGRVVYASPGLAGVTLPPQATEVGQLTLAGRPYGSALVQSGRWQLRMLEPAIPSAPLLQLIVNELLVPILIALPLILLPLWWAVRRGLSPLRNLVAQVTARRSDDFSPLDVNLRFAELQPMEEAFNKLYEQSRDALSRERALVQDAAHELRTPLAVIATQAHVLASSEPGSAQQEALARLEQAIARASHQIHQVLTLARLEGSSVRAVENVDCVETVRQSLINSEALARAQGVELAFEAPEQLHALLDAVAFHSVIDNLMSNALHHASGATRIDVTLGVGAGTLSLRVCDDGCGIAEADREAIFERFHRGRTATASGSGLGLAIVREAARRLGGDVKLVPSITGRGACFELRMPWKPG